MGRIQSVLQFKFNKVALKTELPISVSSFTRALPEYKHQSVDCNRSSACLH